MDLHIITQESINFETINPLIINISTAILILLSGLLIGKLITLLIKKILIETKADQKLKQINPLKLSITNLITILITIPIYIATIILALNQLGILNITLTILITIFLLAITGSLILGIKDLPKNIIAGIKINKKNILNKKIRIGTVYGQVTKKNLIRVEIKTKKNDRIIIPNNYFLKNYRKLAKWLQNTSNMPKLSPNISRNINISTKILQIT